MINLSAFFNEVFNRQKTRTVTRSLGTRILRFSRETKLTYTMQKLSNNSRWEQRGRGDHRPWIRHCIQTCVPVQNFSQIRSTVAEDMHPKQTDSKLHTPPVPQRDNKQNVQHKYINFAITLHTGSSVWVNITLALSADRQGPVGQFSKNWPASWVRTPPRGSDGVRSMG